MSRRLDVRAILADPVLRRKLLARCLRATQAREGREITWERAYEVYDKIRRETGGSNEGGGA